MASVVGVMMCLGMDHPPFPQAGPFVPPPAQPGHDGAGPSGTHHGNSDDDGSEQGTEDEEGKYECTDESVRGFGLILCILILIFVYLVGCI